jgi:hypothetical protein
MRIYIIIGLLYLTAACKTEKKEETVQETFVLSDKMLASTKTD